MKHDILHVNGLLIKTNNNNIYLNNFICLIKTFDKLETSYDVCA